MFPKAPLNQVFMNLLANAIDAIEESLLTESNYVANLPQIVANGVNLLSVENKGKITIRTTLHQQSSL